MSRKTVLIIHWIATVAFVVPLAWSAIQYLTEAPKMVETMTVHLGYPMYFLKFLGVAKLLGVAALLVNRQVRLKEWAYAGFTFDLIGAFASRPGGARVVGRPDASLPPGNNGETRGPPPTGGGPLHFTGSPS